MSISGVAQYLRRVRGDGHQVDGFHSVPVLQQANKSDDSITRPRSHWAPLGTKTIEVAEFKGIEKTKQLMEHQNVENQAANTDRSASSTKCALLELPREIRDMIYSELYRIHNGVENRMIIEPARLAVLQIDNSLPTVARYFPSAITQSNKQLAAEYVQHILETKCVYVRSGPQVLQNFFRLLNRTHFSYIKAIEMDWRTIPYDFYTHLHEAEDREIWPLFGFIKMYSNIKAITVPLHFLEAPGAIKRPEVRHSSETLVFHQSKYEVLRYWRVVGAYAIGLLLHGSLNEVHIKLRPYDTWTLFEPSLKVREIASVHWKLWDIEGIDVLDDLQHQLRCRGHAGIDLRTLIVDVKVQTWTDENIGEELIITLHRPARFDADSGTVVVMSPVCMLVGRHHS